MEKFAGDGHIRKNRISLWENVLDLWNKTDIKNLYFWGGIILG